MKKFIYLLTIISLLFASCNPNEELYEELDQEINKPYSEEIAYTFTADDYSAAANYALKNLAEDKTDSTYADYIKNNKAFNNHYQAKDLVPSVLATNFLALNIGSSAQVSFNMTDSSLIDYSDVAFYLNKYTLAAADYDSWGTGINDPGGFNNFSESAGHNPDTYIQTIISTLFTADNPEAKDYVLITYKYKYSDKPLIDSTDLYVFNGNAWSVDNEAKTGIKLKSADYTSMGLSNSYFATTEDADFYLPRFLKVAFPYAKEGEVIVISYKASGQNLSDEYTLKSQEWMKTVEIYTETEQYVYFPDGIGWMFDPTIRFEMVASDYQLIVDEDIYLDSYGTGGFYYGANSYYRNFDLRINKRLEVDPDTFTGLTDEEANAIIFERLKEGLIIMLQKKYPEAGLVNGLPVNYEVTYATYNNDYSRGKFTMIFECTGAGTPPQFEFVEGPIDLLN